MRDARLTAELALRRAPALPVPSGAVRGASRLVGVASALAALDRALVIECDNQSETP